MRAHVLSWRILKKSFWCSYCWRSLKTTESRTLRESDSVITVEGVLPVRVILQLRAAVLFLFWFEKVLFNVSVSNTFPFRSTRRAYCICRGLIRFLINAIDARIALQGAEIPGFLKRHFQKQELKSSLNHQTGHCVSRSPEGLHLLHFPVIAYGSQ